MEPFNNTVELLNSKQVRKILQCSLPYVYKIADKGKIPCVRIPGMGEEGKRGKCTLRFKLSDIEDFIEKHYTGNNK